MIAEAGVPPHPLLGGACHSGGLTCRGCHLGIRHGRPQLDLDERQPLAAHRDQVNLTGTRPMAAIENAVPLQ